MPSAALRAVATGALVAALVGALSGALDQGLRAVHPALAVQRGALLGAMVLYAVPWALVGALVVGLGCGDRARAATAGAWAWSLALSLLVVGGGWANIHWLGSLFSAGALLFDALATLGCVALALVFTRRLPRRSPGRTSASAGGALLLVLAAGSVVAWGPRADRGGGRSTARTEGPDILVVLLDALRADHCSVYGYERPTTPTLEELASAGAVFELAYAPSSWTKPSVASLFTGLYPASHRNHRIASRLPPDADTLPSVLQRSGYRTAVFAENSFVSALFGYDRGVDHLAGTQPDLPSQTILGHLLHQVTARAPSTRPLLDAARAANVLDPGQVGREGEGIDLPTAFLRWVDALAPQERFFGYVHLMKPHAPYVCPEPFDGAFGEPSPPGGDSPVEPPHVEGIAPFTRAAEKDAEFRRRLVANYDERILYGDHLVSRILDGLHARGRDRDLAVLVLADHGEEFGEHGLWDHGHSLQEGVVRIPFLLVAPGRVAPGTRVEGPVRLLDAAPTVFDLAGVEVPGQFEGRSVLSLIAVDGKEVPAREDARPVLATLEHGAAYRSEALITGGLKLVRSSDGDRRSRQLFDLDADPGESNDLAQTGHDALMRLEAELDAAMTAAARHHAEGGEVLLDPATQERLRALGYIQ